MTLSFCIPTYQRKELLVQTLESILSQDPSIEIVISDNGSYDGTKEYILSLLPKYPQILYHRWETSVEVGKNLLHVVSLAKTKYVWLLTDDDCLEEGALSHVLSILSTYPNLTGVSVNVEGYDKHMQQKKKIRYSHTMKNSKLFTNAEECFFHLGAWFGYWSSHILLKEKWDEGLLDPLHLSFTGYHHLYLVTSMLKKNPLWYFSYQKCIAYRADNESFAQEFGVFKRYAIDAFTYKAICRHFFDPYPHILFKVQNTVLNEYHVWQLVSLKCNKVSLKTQLKLLLLSLKEYYLFKSFWIKVLPLILTPRLLLLAIRRVYRSWKKY